MKVHLWPTASLLEAKKFNTFRAGEEFRRRADIGLARAAETLADALRARGLDASPGLPVESRARVHIEGAGIVAREFGALERAASPVVAPIVRAQRREIARAIAAEITRRTS